MLTVVILLAIYSLIVTWISIVQVTRCNKLENITNNIVSVMDEISDIISDTTEKLRDNRLTEAFSEDDEVGVFFKQLQDIQSTLNSFVFVREQDYEETIGE